MSAPRRLPAEDPPEQDHSEVRRNRVRIIAASALQNAGDQAVNAKAVLPWLLTALGAPTWSVGLLVPIRESGSMLPQAALTPWIRRQVRRKRVWAAGAVGQAVATAAMAVAAATASGTSAAVIILVALATFALARALSSIAAKDVLGRTIPAGSRGGVTGMATAVSGGVAILAGLGLGLLGGHGSASGLLAWLLGGAAALWVVAAVVYGRVAEPPGEPPDENGTRWWASSWALLREDAPFRNFVIVRALLLVSALSPPFIVALASQRGDDLGLDTLGPFLIASGLASLLGGRVFGRLADRSSRRVMAVGAGAASLVILALLALMALPTARESAWLYPAAYLLLALVHVGVRVARKTYVVDMAGGNKRTEYVAVSNTAIGVLLLVTGAVSSALAQLGPVVALAFLAALGVLGAVLAGRLPEIEGPGAT